MAEGGSVRKVKRTAEHQINKDEDPEGDGVGEEVEAGTFQRASAEVLKTRKIVKVRSRSPAEQPAAAASANPFASLGSTSSAGAAAANPFQSVVLSTKPADAAPSAETATLSATPPPAASATNGGSGNASAAAAAASDGGGASSSATPASAETPPSPKPAAAAAAAATGDPQSTAEASAGGDAASQDEATAEAKTERKAPENGTKKEGEEDGDKPSPGAAVDSAKAGDGAAKEEKPAAKEEKPAVAGVVSFATLGGGGTAAPFKSLGTAGTSAIGGGAAPLSFGGFGSTAAPSPLGAGASAGLGLSGSGAKLNGSTAAGPVLSFGSSTGKAGASFSSFTSFASAPTAGGGWGIPAKKDGGGSGSGTGTADGGSSGGGGKKEDGKGTASGSSATDVSTKAPLELMDPSEVINGEELEECTHKARGKLFRLTNKEWAEMGIGNLKVLRSAVSKDADGSGDANPEETKTSAAATARLVMRREAGQQVMINVSLQAQTKCSMQGEKALLLTCFTADGPATYLLKVKTPEIASALKASIDVLLPPPASEEDKEGSAV
ncbi:unnamed protein product [Ectocarpus sp. 13 AM-2016]